MGENHSASQDKDQDQTDTEQEDESDVDKNNTGNNNAGSDQQKQHLSDQSEPPSQHAVENPENNSSVLVTARHHLPQPLLIAQSAIERISNTCINTSNSNSSVSIGDCFDFVARAKEQLLRLGQTENYDRFIEILSTWKERALTWEEVFVDMTLILKYAPELLDEFLNFLPSGARLELKAMGSIAAGEKNGKSD